MATLTNIIYYLLDAYPNKAELSNARVTKMIYLADWHSAIMRNKQVTNISWFFNNFGPFVSDILQEIEAHPNLFSITHTSTYLGNQKTLFGINKETSFIPNLEKEEIDILDKVISVTKEKTWDQFITFVYSTFPIANSDRYKFLDLVKMAEEYKKNKS